MRWGQLVVLIPILLAGCATSQTASSDGKTQAQVLETETSSGKTIDEMLDENDQVRIVDSETGEDKIICKREATTGSRLGGRKVCATKKEWDQAWSRGSNTTSDMQRQLGANPTNTP